MVKELRRDNGQGGWLRSAYYYEGALADAHGRGDLGFAKIAVTDVQTGVVVVTTLAQDHPYTGMVLASNTSAGLNGDVSSGTTVILSETINRLSKKAVAQANGAIIVFPFIAGTTISRHYLNGADLGVVTTAGPDSAGDIQYDDWGNLLGSKATSVGIGKTFSHQTINSFLNDGVAWLSLNKGVAITKTDPDSGTVTRTLSFDYDLATGQLKTETTQPGSQQFQIVTTFGRASNPFGLINTMVQSWLDPATKTSKTRTVTDTSYDPKGRFPVTVKNALGQSATYSYDPATGAERGFIDPNQLSITRKADGFGRLQSELRSDGNEVRSYVKACQRNCPFGAVVAKITEAYHGNSRMITPQVLYLDGAGRVRRMQTWGFDGRAVVSDQRYDSAGRLFETDQARFDDAPAYLMSRQSYDALNRLKKVVSLDDGSAEQSGTITYDGINTTFTNAKLQNRVNMRNVIGQVIKVEDALHGVTKLEYDPFVNLAKTTDPAGNLIVVSYDLMGRKTKLFDPDIGVIDYFVDPIGQVWKQISPVQRAKEATTPGQFTTFEYDVLGRMTARFETDLESHWEFDTAIMGIGQLAEAYTGKTNVNLRDYRRIRNYDSLGRLKLTTQVLNDGTYTARNDYDEWNRAIRTTYQHASDGAKVFDTRYGNMGDLERIERGGLPLWRVMEKDAAQRPTKLTLGNGLTQVHRYNRFTARLENGALSTSSNVARLQESYLYDVLGNVSNRSQYWDQGGFQEDFKYDELNRLTKSTVLGQPLQTFVYDQNAIGAGNLTSKTGIGAYTYPLQGSGVVRPHAVKSIASIGDLLYDDNGNLTSGGGRTVDWNSFDMPIRIAKGSIFSIFAYGSEHQRTRQDRSDGSVVIYAGAQEVERKSGQMTVKTYWPGAVGVEIDRPSASAAELSWIHLDRLGSVIGMTDQAGVLRERLAYDVWGKRRMIDGSSTPDTLDGLVDNRGFTGHEMLDQLDLVHMNGRVYDSFTARFLSADPFVQEPSNGQNYNRYSYVLNNPTNLTDPTGFYFTETLAQVAVAARGGQSQGEIDAAARLVKFNSVQIRTIDPVAARKQAPQAKSAISRNYVGGLTPDIPISAPGKPRPTCDSGMQCVEIVGHNPDKGQNTGWGAAVRMTHDWVTGGGAANRHFDGSTSSTQNMMSARRVNEARAYFYKKMPMHLQVENRQKP